MVSKRQRDASNGGDGAAAPAVASDDVKPTRSVSFDVIATPQPRERKYNATFYRLLPQILGFHDF